MATDSYQRRRESPHIGSVVETMMRSLVCRAAEGDLEAVEQLRRLEDLAPVYLSQGVAAARQHSPHYSWAVLAPYLGVSRTSASGRFRDAVAPQLHVALCGRKSWTQRGRDRHEARCVTCASLPIPCDVCDHPDILDGDEPGMVHLDHDVMVCSEACTRSLLELPETREWLEKAGS